MSRIGSRAPLGTSPCADPCSAGCPGAGSLLPVSCTLVGPTYTDDVLTAGANVMDLLVTTDIAARVTLGFRWYAHTDVYTSPRASSVYFVTNRALAQGAFLRLVYNTTTGIGMKLLYRPPYSGPDPAWSEVAYSTSSIGLLNFYAASCLVFFAPSFQAMVGICAITFTVRTELLPATDPPTYLDVYGTPPPQCVVPCQFTFAPYVANPDVLKFVHVEDIAPAGAWINLWQTLKWGPDTTWRVASDTVDYPETVDEAETRAYLVLLPGQLVPVAYRPYAVENGAFGGQWVLVVTKPIPPQTRVAIAVNDWQEGHCEDPGVVQTLAYLWTSPVCSTLPAGAVVDFTGLGTSCVRVSVGTIATNPVWRDYRAPITLPIDLYAYTAFSTRIQVLEEDGEFVTQGDAHPITATYPCSYTGTVPQCLVLGRDLLATPWPDCPSILPINPARVVPSWPCEQLVLNNLCPVRWLCQPVPAFGFPRPDNAACCCTTPLPACAGTVFGCVSCGGGGCGSGCGSGSGSGSGSGPGCSRR